MSKTLNIDSEIINNYLKNQQYNKLGEYYKTTFKIKRNSSDEVQKYAFSKEVFDNLHKTLQNIDLPHTDNTKILIKELFRALRNYSINSEVQDYAAVNERFLQDVVKVIDSEILNHSDHKDCLQLILQFLINLVINNEASSNVVYNVFKDRLINMLKNDYCTYETSALMHNLCLYNSIELLDIEFYEIIFELYSTHDEVEFLYFFLENFINSNKFWNNYKTFQSRHRVVVLEIIRNKQIKNNCIKLTAVAVEAMIQKFLHCNEIIFQTVESNNTNLEPFEVSLLLEILASLSSDERFMKLLQNDKNFIINIGILLINVHRLGKTSDNYFSSVQKLSEVREPNELMRQHPAFGFKVGLIRILGNLSWKNSFVQDILREAELIPVLLDCCNIDARNPFIMQWVILAVRNLCENNVKNQQFIAELHEEGKVSSAILEEMGLTLHADDGNSIKMISLDALQNNKSAFK